jgi:hypothetical protein
MPLWDKLGIEDRLPEIEEWYKAGATDKDVYDKLGVSKSTYNKWKGQHPGLLSLLKRGKSVADQMVINALYHKATGYSFEEDELFHYQGSVTKVRVLKHVPPSDTAMIFWLKNRLPEEWKDRIDFNHVKRLELVKVLASLEGEDALKYIESGEIEK